LRILTIFISLFFSLATIAHAAPPVINEEQERQKIVDSLTYRLETKPACVQSLKWSDKGSGADLDGFFFIPTAEQSFFMIGGYGSQINESKPCVLSVRESSRNPSGTPKLLAPPKGWELTWTDKGSGADQDGSFWKAIPHSSEYRCLGSVPQAGYSKPSLATYRCVHSSLTQPVSISELVWSDKGSGADKDVTLFKLPNTASFVAVSGKASQADAFDIKPDATSKPDTDIVEAKLAERMSQMKAEAEASPKAKEEKLAEEKRQLDEEKRKLEEEKRQAAKAKAEAQKAEAGAKKAEAEKAEAEVKASPKAKEEKLAEEKRQVAKASPDGDKYYALDEWILTEFHKRLDELKLMSALGAPKRDLNFLSMQVDLPLSYLARTLPKHPDWTVEDVIIEFHNEFPLAKPGDDEIRRWYPRFKKMKMDFSAFDERVGLIYETKMGQCKQNLKKMRPTKRPENEYEYCKNQILERKL
jgi:hypothetical protein